MFRHRILIPLIIIIGLLAATALSANWWLKIAFIRAGESAVEAKVDIDKVRVTVSPFGLKIIGLQITNPKSTMRNIVEIGQIQFALNTRAALEKKWIIEQIGIENISVDSPRKTSGYLAKYATKNKKRSQLSRDLEAGLDTQMAQLKTLIPELKLPKTDDLKTVKAYAKAKADLEAMQKKWDNTLSGKPFQADLDSINTEIATLQNPNTTKITSLQDIAKVNAIIQSVNKTLAHVQALNKKVADTQAQFDQDKAHIGTAIASIPAAGKEDMKDTMAPFSADKFKQLNFSTAVLMDPIKRELIPIMNKIQIAMYYKKKFASPNPPKLRGRDAGEDILFDKQNHYPKYWVKHIIISGTGKNGERVTGEVTNITSDQRLIGKPLHVSLSGENLLQHTTNFHATLTQDKRHAATVNNINLGMTGFPLIKYISKNSGPIQVTQGQVDLNSHLTIVGKTLASNTTAQVSHLHINSATISDPKDIWNLNSITADILSQVTLLNINLLVNGPFKHLTIGISTNIDDIFAAAISNTIQKRLDAQKAAIQRQIDNIVSDKKADAEKEFNTQKAKVDTWIAQQQAQINAIQKQIEDQKTALEKQINGQKDQAEKQAQDQINKETEKAKQKVQNAIQNQLKGLFH